MPMSNLVRLQFRPMTDGGYTLSVVDDENRTMFWFNLKPGVLEEIGQRANQHLACQVETEVWPPGVPRRD